MVSYMSGGCLGFLNHQQVSKYVYLFGEDRLLVKMTYLTYGFFPMTLKRHWMIEMKSYRSWGLRGIKWGEYRGIPWIYTTMGSGVATQP